MKIFWLKGLSIFMIIITGLGPGNIGCLTLESWEIIKNASKIFLRTMRHPCAEDLRARGIVFESFDRYYEEMGSFEEVYGAIAAAVLSAAADGTEVVFAVPGSPLVAEKTVELIIAGAREKTMPLKIIPAMSFLETLYARLKINPAAGLTVVDTADVAALPENIGTALVITQVFDQKSASEAKLALMNYYDDDYPVVVASNLGLPDEKLSEVPLFEMDRLCQINHLTSVYVPPRASGGERFSLDPLVNIMAMLRSPKGGCAWDLEQTSKSIGGYLVEEVYEVLEAINLGDSNLLAEELGDLLLHIVFQARMAEEKGLFSMKDVVAGVSAKMIRRHPHVFGDTKVKSAADVIVNWDKIKKQEKHGQRNSFLDGIPQGAPSLLRAFKLQVKAAKAGFDWDSEEPVWEKVYEELAELKEAIEIARKFREIRINGAEWDKTKSNDEFLDKVQSELGDAFFALVNLARFLNADPETSLHMANNKFTRRFHYMEQAAAKQGRSLLDFDLGGLDNLWEEAKKNLPRYS